ncbi:hypothetical protein [Winogradskyella aquimaris]|uniref:DKNYY family protein n=1 Tax=Winogradskyella aquimaris TaxID=864074 RepID=A0ABU5ESJ9_9FLAO|nr:hypothetical protein [Winogradskyella aquimaris]MDY2588528.1 hypothetical protein [Winogradskyella aquimaris]
MIRTLLTLLLLSNFCFSQEKEKIEAYNGIWIAEEYYNSFEKTKSCLESKNSFAPNEPVGLRINSSEIKNGILNVGFSSLHDHLLRPEVSEYIVNGKDTIREQGHFKINLSKQISSNEFPTTEIMFFNDNWKSSLILGKNTIILYRPKNKDFKERKIKFIRVEGTFDNNYKYPNPVYFYTRKTLLEGNYTLKDSTNKIITSDLKINVNGVIKGYVEFENKKIYYSTDIYCGPPALDELVLICGRIEDYNPDCTGFVFKRINENTIHLYKRYPRRVEYPKNEIDTKKIPLGKVYYKLIKN